MILFRKLKLWSPRFGLYADDFSATPALADGFQRANTVMQKCQPGCMVWRQSRSPWP